VTICGASMSTSESDFAADTVTVAIDVCGLSAFVEISHADVRADTLVIDSKGGNDNVSVDPALAGLIQVSAP